MPACEQYMAESPKGSRVRRWRSARSGLVQAGAGDPVHCPAGPPGMKENGEQGMNSVNYTHFHEKDCATGSGGPES
jgi:hypothetical protein